MKASQNNKYDITYNDFRASASKVIIEKSCSAVGDFYGTGFEIWAGFGPIGSTEKKGSGLIMSNF